MMSENYQHGRDNAVRLLALFTATGVPRGAAMTNAWVLDIATGSGLDDREIVSGLNYAVERNWLKIGSNGLLLTKAGKAAAISSWKAAA
jgi:hypothetical protein